MSDNNGTSKYIAEVLCVFSTMFNIMVCVCGGVYSTSHWSKINELIPNYKNCDFKALKDSLGTDGTAG